MQIVCVVLQVCLERRDKSIKGAVSYEPLCREIINFSKQGQKWMKFLAMKVHFSLTTTLNSRELIELSMYLYED